MKKIIILSAIFFSACTSKYNVNAPVSGQDVVIVAPESAGDEKLKSAGAGVISAITLVAIIGGVVALSKASGDGKK